MSIIERILMSIVGVICVALLGFSVIILATQALPSVSGGEYGMVATVTVFTAAATVYVAYKMYKAIF